MLERTLCSQILENGPIKWFLLEKAKNKNKNPGYLVNRSMNTPGMIVLCRGVLVKAKNGGNHV